MTLSRLSVLFSARTADGSNIAVKVELVETVSGFKSVKSLSLSLCMDGGDSGLLKFNLEKPDADNRPRRDVEKYRLPRRDVMLLVTSRFRPNH